MQLSTTLARYVGRQFLFWFAAAFFSLIAVLLVVDFVELMRRAASKPSATLGVSLDMALLRLPYLAQELVPFAILFGGMIAFCAFRAAARSW